MEYAHAMGHGMGFGLGFLNFIGTILFFVAIFWFVRLFVFGRRYRYGSRGPWSRRGRGWGRWDDGGSGEDDALKMAKARFAQGKISAEEFETIRSGLGSDEDDARGGPSFPDLSNLGSMGSNWGRERALDIARTRFAKGEITKEEFETVKRTLEN